LVERGREVIRAAFAHQELPFERLIATLGPERESSRLPLLRVMLAYQEDIAWSMEFEDRTWTLLEGDTGAPKFDLMLTLSERGDDLLCMWEYDRQLFDPGTIERTHGHWANLLARAAATPGEPISNISLLGKRELNKIVREWNATRIRYPGDGLL